LGAKFLVVLCAGSTLLLVQSKALDEAPYKLSRVVAKLAGITFLSLAFSYWFDKPRFLTEGRLATVLIIPSSWGSQLGGYLPASSIFFGSVAREKEDFCKGSLARTIFYFVYCFALLYFCLHLFIKNTHKNSFLIVVIFTCLLLALLEWVVMRTPSCTILLALIIVTLSALLLRHMLLLQIFMILNLLY
jgi:hypothetical protein